MARGIKESLLIGSGALLVLLTVLLLVSLRGPAEQDETEPMTTPPPAGFQIPAQPVEESTSTTPSPPPSLQPAPAVRASSPAPPMMAPAPPPPDQSVPSLSPFPVAREIVRLSPGPNVSPLLAPAAEPLELQNEPDPRRREMLRRMHKLAVAKMRQGVFTRRAQLLEQSMAEGQASGTWTKEKVDQAKADLVQLEQSINASTANVEKFKAEVDQEITE